MDEKRTQEQVAAELAQFLTTSGRGYGSKSPLDEIINAQITQLALGIAADVIAATPELAAHVRRQCEYIVRDALNKDHWLNETVVRAVAQAVTGLALERQRDADN